LLRDDNHDISGESLSDDEGSDVEGDDESDGDPDYHAQGRNLPTTPWLHVGAAIISYMVTITAVTWDVSPALVEEIAYILSRMALLTRWWVCYERGGLNAGGHNHILMEGPFSAASGHLTNISNFWRRVLRLARKTVNGAKHVYKVHSKVTACTCAMHHANTQWLMQCNSGSTQSFELTCAYLSKDAGACPSM
jgi:hypothetical protein